MSNRSRILLYTYWTMDFFLSHDWNINFIISFQYEIHLFYSLIASC